MKYIPQAASSPIKHVSSTKQTKREKTVPKELQPTSAEDQQIAELLRITKQADEQLQKLLQRKRQETQRAIPKQTSTKQHSSSQKNFFRIF